MQVSLGGLGVPAPRGRSADCWRTVPDGKDAEGTGLPERAASAGTGAMSAEARVTATCLSHCHFAQCRLAGAMAYRGGGDESAPSLLSPSSSWLFLRSKTRRWEPAQGRPGVKGARKLPEARPRRPIVLCQSATPDGSKQSAGPPRGRPGQDGGGSSGPVRPPSALTARHVLGLPAPGSLAARGTRHTQAVKTTWATHRRNERPAPRGAPASEAPSTRSHVFILKTLSSW